MGRGIFVVLFKVMVVDTCVKRKEEVYGFRRIKSENGKNNGRKRSILLFLRIKQ